MYEFLYYLEIGLTFIYLSLIAITGIIVCKVVPLADRALRKYLGSNPHPDSYIYYTDDIKKVSQNQIP